MAKLLNNKREQFCQEYLKDCNATQAAIRAGYSPKTANEQGARLLVFVSVAERIKYLQAELSEKTGITAVMVINEYAKIAFSNISDYASFSEDGVKLKDSEAIPLDQLAAISEVSESITKEGGKINFKLHSKTTALDALGRHLGIFERDNIYRIKVDNLKEILGLIDGKTKGLPDNSEVESS